jgi:hypothetical protein
MLNINDFREDLLETCNVDFESRGISQKTSFFEARTQVLTNLGELPTDVIVGILPKFDFYGYCFDNDLGNLQLISLYFDSGTLRALPKKEADSIFNNLKKFYQFSITKKFTELEETSEAYSCCEEIYKLHIKNQINSIELVLLSDLQIPKSLWLIEEKTLMSLPCKSRIFDIGFFYEAAKNNEQFSNIEVYTSIPCLIVSEPGDVYDSYLGVISGNQLAEIYDKNKSKLLEENIRTFLQFKGKINQGIKNTLQYSPNYFFAYNNGITATATEVEVADNKIVKIKNLQIVNGGQTTASIYTAKRNHAIDLKSVKIQIKLSVLKNWQETNDFVSKIAKYANTQNSVNASDFFSNHQYHLDMKKISERITVQRTTGSQIKSKWYYERVRGEYLNAQTYLNKSEKDKFLLVNPKNQFVDKIGIGKSENSWHFFPYFASLGGQGSFKKFAEDIIAKMETNKDLVTDTYFKDVISRFLIFRNFEKVISSASWYTGGFRAQTVAYSMSLLSYHISNNLQRVFNFNEIWNSQSIGKELEIQLANISKKVHLRLNEFSGNISVWAKKKDCWEAIKNINCSEIEIPDIYLETISDSKAKIIEGRKIKKSYSDAEAIVYVMNQKVSTWVELVDYYAKEPLPSFARRSLEKYVVSTGAIPTENEAKILSELIRKALEEGYKLDQ